MRYSVIKALTKRMMTADESGEYVGYRSLLDKMEKAGWIKPCIPTAKIKLYDVQDLDLCCDRLKSGETPE